MLRRQTFGGREDMSRVRSPAEEKKELGGKKFRETLRWGEGSLEWWEYKIKVSRVVFTTFLGICFTTFLEQRGLQSSPLICC